MNFPFFTPFNISSLVIFRVSAFCKPNVGGAKCRPKGAASVNVIRQPIKLFYYIQEFCVLKGKRFKITTGET